MGELSPLVAKKRIHGHFAEQHGDGLAKQALNWFAERFGHFPSRPVLEFLLGGQGAQPHHENQFHNADEQRRSEEHTPELQSLMRISYAVFCLKKKKTKHKQTNIT